MIEDLPDFPALQAIRDALWHVSDVRGAAVMVGSGFSTNAELPSPASRKPPLWSNMAAAMERRLGKGSSGAANPTRLAEEFRALLGQSALDGLVRDLVPDAEWRPGRAHRRLLELPWSDVLTTNWDTLLERAKADLADRSYDVVLTPADIARTRSPRIVKLHGTLPSHTPFVFAEEDYRTYPVRFAPFVNLAQHVLLENELLLLGFSGDDPNFLAWAGWVRDQLGAYARRIRLAGVLDLSPARRRYLENLNVTPIDLAPTVAVIADPTLRHARATSILLDALHGGKPTPIHVWKRSGGLAADATAGEGSEQRVEDLVRSWKADRDCAPDWLVAPQVERAHLRMETSNSATAILSQLSSVSPGLRGRFAAELGWRLETGHFGVPSWARLPLTEALDEPDSGLAAQERTRLGALLALDAIERRDAAEFAKLVEGLDGNAPDDPDSASWAAYLRGLEARDRFDFGAILAAVGRVRGDDPVWLFRRAALLCAAFDSRGAALLIRQAMVEIKRKRALDRRSLWLLSREAWGRFLWRNLHFELRDDDERPDLGDDWPLVYNEHRIDPWDEMNALEVEIRQDQERRRRFSGAERVHFEPGSWTPAASAEISWTGAWVAPAEFQIRRLGDLVGVPWRASTTDILANRLIRSLPDPASGTTDETMIWRVATYIRSEDGGLIEDWFGRVAVAGLPVALVDALVVALRGAADQLASSLSQGGEGYSDRVEGLRARLELLSRLAMRTAPETAREMVDLAISTFERGGRDHWWLFKATSHLIERSIAAIPPSERASLVERMLTFPLPGEARIEGIERDWPEFSDAFEPSGVRINRPEGEWNGRIATLLDWVAKHRGDQRHRALARLSLLYRKKALTSFETERLAAAAWAWRTSDTGLPADTNYYPAAMAMLPEPRPGMAREAFARDVIDPLLAGDVRSGALESLAYMGSSADKGRGVRLFDPETAARLVASIPWSKAIDRDLASRAISFGLLPIAPMDDALADLLWDRSGSTGIDGRVLLLPYVARHDPTRRDEAAARIEHALGTTEFRAVNSALEAVRIWARLVVRADFPTRLTKTVVNLVATRREPGLFRALDVCVDLVAAGLLDADDARRVVEGLGYLLTETEYEGWRLRDFRTATLTFVRANGVRLARALAKAGHEDAVIDKWIAVAASDAAPEVRFVTDDHD